MHFCDEPEPAAPVAPEEAPRAPAARVRGRTGDGRLSFGLQDNAYNSACVARFLKRLLRRIKGKILLFWDGSNIHGGPPVRELLASPEGARIQAVRLPGYAPELNPVELVWGQIKHVEMKNVCCDTLAELRATIERAVRRLRRKGDILRAFVRHALPP